MNSLISTPKSIIYIFIDGIGLGVKDAQINPFSRFPCHFFAPLGGKLSFPENGYLISTDAQMGYPGAPQSATGQTALFTGYNGAKLVGRHINGFPTYTLRPYILNHSVVKKFVEAGLKASVLNSYTNWYLDKLKQPRSERIMSATTLMQKGSGQALLTMEDFLEGRSLFMDITNWFLRTRATQKYDIPLVSPKEVGRKLVHISKEYNLTIYEYFFTDKIGHEGSMAAAKRILPHIEGLLEGIWEEMDPSKELLIISSDHGNFEDLSHTRHTENKVPTILYGCGADSIYKQILSLYDIPKAIMKLNNLTFNEDLVL